MLITLNDDIQLKSFYFFFLCLINSFDGDKLQIASLQTASNWRWKKNNNLSK